MDIEDNIAKIIKDIYAPTGFEDEGRSMEAAHNIIQALDTANYIIVSKQDYEDAIWGRTRLSSGGYLSPTNWPRDPQGYME
jgi:hypothetical protein